MPLTRVLANSTPLVILLVSVEGLCRIFPSAGPTSRISYIEPDPELIWRLKPLAGGPQATNELGLRDTAYRADADVKILLLGDSISYSLPKLRSLLSAPNLMAVAALEDRETFTRGMDGLLGMIKELGEIEGQRTDYRGATLYSWSLADAAADGGMGAGGLMGGLPIDPSTFFRPTITVMDDRVLLSTLPTHAKREVRRVAKLLKAGEEATLHAGLVETGIADGASMVNFADWEMLMW